MGTLFAAKALGKAGSKAAKRRGLSEKLKQTIEARRRKKAATCTQGAKEAGEANKPKRTRLRKKRALLWLKCKNQSP